MLILLFKGIAKRTHVEEWFGKDDNENLETKVFCQEGGKSRLGMKLLKLLWLKESPVPDILHKELDKCHVS